MPKNLNCSKFLFLLLLIGTINVYSQTEVLKKDKSIPYKIFSGVSNSLSYYDIPVYLTFLYRKDLADSFISNKITLNPFDFEKNFAINSVRDETSSIGSINKDLIPGIVLGAGFATTLTLDALGASTITERDYRRIFMFYKTLLYTYTITEVVKTVVKRERPNKKDFRSFFSGHSSTTFAAAHFLNKELHYIIDKSNISDETTEFILKAISSTLTYGWASIVAYSRVNDNQHYLTDVLLGAGAGLLISELLHKSMMWDENSKSKIKIISTTTQIGINYSLQL